MQKLPCVIQLAFDSGGTLRDDAKSLITILPVISLLMSNFAMIVSYAAIQDYPVELAFNNIFVFDKWVSNRTYHVYDRPRT